MYMKTKQSEVIIWWICSSHLCFSSSYCVWHDTTIESLSDLQTFNENLCLALICRWRRKMVSHLGFHNVHSLSLRSDPESEWRHTFGLFPVLTPEHFEWVQLSEEFQLERWSLFATCCQVRLFTSTRRKNLLTVTKRSRNLITGQ